MSFPSFRVTLDCFCCLSWHPRAHHSQQHLTFTKNPWVPGVRGVGSALGWLVTYRPISCLFFRYNCWPIVSDFSMAGKTLESALKITTRVVWNPPWLRIYWWLLGGGGKGICRVKKKWKIKILSSNTSLVHFIEMLCVQQHSISWCHTVIHSTNIYWARYWRYNGELEYRFHKRRWGLCFVLCNILITYNSAGPVTNVLSKWMKTEKELVNPEFAWKVVSHSWRIYVWAAWTQWRKSKEHCLP